MKRCRLNEPSPRPPPGMRKSSFPTGAARIAPWRLPARSGARIVSGDRGRAGQQNRGAAAARGEVLLFLHADTRLPRNYADHVFDVLMDRRTVLGSFRFETDLPDAGHAVDCLVHQPARRLAQPPLRRPGSVSAPQRIFYGSAVSPTHPSPRIFTWSVNWPATDASPWHRSPPSPRAGAGGVWDRCEPRWST